ncbi:MAG: hypothetical protein RL346_2249 [Verrucomicrobiota bacterium]|jgi:hypothetical protein
MKRVGSCSGAIHGAGIGHHPACLRREGTRHGELRMGTAELSEQHERRILDEFSYLGEE